MNKFTKLSAVALLASIGTSAFAATNTTATAAVTDAVANAKLDVAAVSAGVLSLAALFFGVGLIVSWLRK